MNYDDALADLTILAGRIENGQGSIDRLREQALDLLLECDPATVNHAQAARLLGCDRSTLYRHLAARKAER